MEYKELFKKVSDYVKLFYIDHTDNRLVYHNQVAAKEMVESAIKIADHYQCDERTRFIVYTAAWFLDTGYLVSGPSSNEMKSAGLAESFLATIAVSEDDIAEIKRCIMVTVMPQHPVSLPEKITCDAHLFYLGTDAYKAKSKLLRKEKEALENIKISRTQWLAQGIALLQTHQYHTDYCRALLDTTKADNLARIKRLQEEKLMEGFQAADMAGEPVTTAGRNSIEEEPGSKAAAAGNNTGRSKKIHRPVRGVETMFRVSSSNHQRLSVMADNKAHIMISVNSIIISVVLGLVVRKLDTNQNLRNLILPTGILLLVNTITIIYSVLATRPKIPNGIFTPEQIARKTPNLLFFGSFYKMGFKEYEAGMKLMMEDSEFLYGSLIKDIYWQGRVLGRKYSLLRMSYNVFMYGVALAILTYTIALFFIKSGSVI